MADVYTYNYEPPEFLQNQSVDEIHERMLNILPSDIDKSEGNLPWDFTRPSAEEKAEFVGYTLNETIKLIFPQWSTGVWLDYHGQKENCIRKPANHASGILKVTGAAGTVIPSGFQFATPAELTDSVLFETEETYTLSGTADASGMVTCEVTVVAVEGGATGNVAAGSIKLMVTPISSISTITNPNAMSGGTEEESDEAYRIRILDAIRSGNSMTGCNADYVRWGKEVSGVGQVIVDPEWNDPSLPDEWHYTDENGDERCAGAVRLLVIDSNGLPANQQIQSAVYDHIAGTGDRDPERLMPIGAKLTVSAPSAYLIDIAAAVIIETGEVLEDITERFTVALSDYWLEVANEANSDMASHTGYVRMVQVGAILAKTAGVIDYTGLTINGGTTNIAVTQAEYPVTGEVTLSAQT